VTPLPALLYWAQVQCCAQAFPPALLDMAQVSCRAQASPPGSPQALPSGSRQHRIVPSSGGQPLPSAGTPFAAKAAQAPRAGRSSGLDSWTPDGWKVLPCWSLPTTSLHA
jgi:hypothetical protein